MEHRRALLRNLSISLIQHKRITTTLAKAKALRRFIEPLITKAKSNTTHSRRVVFSYLQNKEAIKELFGNVAVTVGDRPGGYVRVIRNGFRKGDGAEMAMIEFVDFNTVYSGQEKPEGAPGKRKRRTRRGSSKTTASETATVSTAVAEEQEEDVVVDEVADEVESDDASGETEEKEEKE
jgi:large subunit ribosomal protein L17